MQVRRPVIRPDAHVYRDIRRRRITSGWRRGPGATKLWGIATGILILLAFIVVWILRRP